MAHRPSKTHKTKIHADRYQYTAVFDPDGKGGYTVTVPALPLTGDAKVIPSRKPKRWSKRPSLPPGTAPQARLPHSHRGQPLGRSRRREYAPLNMTRLTATAQQVIRVLERQGWQLDHTRSSHYYYRHPTKPRHGKCPLPQGYEPQTKNTQIHSRRRRHLSWRLFQTPLTSANAERSGLVRHARGTGPMDAARNSLASRVSRGMGRPSAAKRAMTIRLLLRGPMVSPVSA